MRDGDLVPSPVSEGEYFAVVWRRGTIAATRRSIEDAGPQIRDAIWKTRVEDETDKLVASLRANKLHDLNESQSWTCCAFLPGTTRPREEAETRRSQKRAVVTSAWGQPSVTETGGTGVSCWMAPQEAPSSVSCVPWSIHPSGPLWWTSEPPRATFTCVGSAGSWVSVKTHEAIVRAAMSASTPARVPRSVESVR